MTNLQIMRRTKLIAEFSDKQDFVADIFEKLRRDVSLVLDQADHRDRRCRIDCARWALII